MLTLQPAELEQLVLAGFRKVSITTRNLNVLVAKVLKKSVAVWF
jgi:hypothetical protein